MPASSVMKCRSIYTNQFLLFIRESLINWWTYYALQTIEILFSKKIFLNMEVSLPFCSLFFIFLVSRSFNPPFIHILSISGLIWWSSNPLYWFVGLRCVLNPISAHMILCYQIILLLVFSRRFNHSYLLCIIFTTPLPKKISIIQSLFKLLKF